MSSMKDVAEKAGVSRATVSRVLAGHPSIKPETRANVLYWVRQLNYQPNTIAQSLAGNKTNILGVIVPEISNPFFSEIIEAIEEEATREGYSIIVYSTKRDIQRERNIINELKSRKVDGILAVPVHNEKSEQTYRAAVIPIVTITKKLNGFNSIVISHRHGGMEVGKHLYRLGHRKIGYVGPKEGVTSAEKFSGFFEYLNSQGLKIVDDITCDAISHIESMEIYHTIRNYISAHGVSSSALFAYSDAAACDTVTALEEMGYKVPEDVAVVGFDNTLLAMKMRPKITSLAQPTTEMGQKGVQLLIELLKYSPSKEEDYNLRVRVIPRESTMGFQND